jgi:copper chaperone CopZ
VDRIRGDRVKRDRLQILSLVKEGKITPEEGVELLSALEETNLEGESIDFNWEDEEAKILKIQIKKVNGKKINLSLPISLVRFFFDREKATFTIDGEKINLKQWWEKSDRGYKGILLDTHTKSGKEIKIEIV